jgi:ADP-ribose pyrophosphatase YjhB (NUDIX family)
MFKLAVACWIKNQNKYLLQKRGLHEKWGPGKWIPPGGKVEMHETVLQALDRELMEEVGVRIDHKTIKYIADYISPIEDDEKIVIVVEAELRDGEARVLDEAIEVKWFTKEELSKLDFVFDSTKDELGLLS